MFLNIFLRVESLDIFQKSIFYREGYGNISMFICRFSLAQGRDPGRSRRQLAEFHAGWMSLLLRRRDAHLCRLRSLIYSEINSRMERSPIQRPEPQILAGSWHKITGENKQPRIKKKSDWPRGDGCVWASKYLGFSLLCLLYLNETFLNFFKHKNKMRRNCFRWQNLKVWQ